MSEPRNYDQLLDEYNDLVDEYNDLAQQHRELLDRYEVTSERYIEVLPIDDGDGHDDFDDEAATIIRSEGLNPEQFHLYTLADGTEVPAFNSKPSASKIDHLFPVATKSGGRLSMRGQMYALTEDRTHLVYPAWYVAEMRAEAWAFIKANMSLNRKHPEMARRHATLAALRPVKRQDRAAMRQIWGVLN